MSRSAGVILADTETEAGLGRVVNATRVAGESRDAGDRVVIFFDGAGTRRVPAHSVSGHPYRDLYEESRSVNAGVCDCCSSADGLRRLVVDAGVRMLDGYGGHPSVRSLAGRGFGVITM